MKPRVFLWFIAFFIGSCGSNNKDDEGRDKPSYEEKASHKIEKIEAQDFVITDFTNMTEFNSGVVVSVANEAQFALLCDALCVKENLRLDQTIHDPDFFIAHIFQNFYRPFYIQVFSKEKYYQYCFVFKVNKINREYSYSSKWNLGTSRGLEQWPPAEWPIDKVNEMKIREFIRNWRPPVATP